MAKTIKQHWEGLPLWGKGLIVAGAAYGVYRIFRTDNDNSGGTTDEITTGGDNFTYPPHQYQLYADMFEAAWLSGPFGVTEDDTAMGAILMEMQTTDDVIALNNAFGTRNVYGWTFLSGGNLSQIVHKYLDNDVKAKVNEDYALKNIAWQWL